MPPRSLPVVAVAALIWNLIGVAAFVVQARMGEAQLAALPPAEQHVWRSMPAQVWTSYAVAVLAGLAAAIGLVARR